MKLSKRQQRLRAKQLTVKGLNEAGKVIYLVKDPAKHTNKNLRPDYVRSIHGKYAQVPISRQYTPEMFDKDGKIKATIFPSFNNN